MLFLACAAAILAASGLVEFGRRCIFDDTDDPEKDIPFLLSRAQEDTGVKYYILDTIKGLFNDCATLVSDRQGLFLFSCMHVCNPFTYWNNCQKMQAMA